MIGQYPMLSNIKQIVTAFIQTPLDGNVAEGVGFEPTVPIRHNGFRDRPVRPLRHPSAPASRSAGGALIEGSHPGKLPVLLVRVSEGR